MYTVKSSMAVNTTEEMNLYVVITSALMPQSAKAVIQSPPGDAGSYVREKQNIYHQHIQPMFCKNNFFTVKCLLINGKHACEATQLELRH